MKHLNCWNIIEKLIDVSVRSYIHANWFLPYTEIYLSFSLLFQQFRIFHRKCISNLIIGRQIFPKLFSIILFVESGYNTEHNTCTQAGQYILVFGEVIMCKICFEEEVNFMKGFMISFFFIRMAEEEEEVRISVEGGTMGIKNPISCPLL